MSKVISRPTPDKKRLRRTMMFMNAQKPGLIKDAYIYGSDSIILDLEDAVAENQKDAARFSLYHALKSIDYSNTEGIVRINGLDTPHWQEDVRVCVAGGADGIRIAKCENADMVRQVGEMPGPAPGRVLDHRHCNHHLDGADQDPLRPGCAGHRRQQGMRPALRHPGRPDPDIVLWHHRPDFRYCHH